MHFNIKSQWLFLPTFALTDDRLLNTESVNSTFFKKVRTEAKNIVTQIHFHGSKKCSLHREIASFSLSFSTCYPARLYAARPVIWYLCCRSQSNSDKEDIAVHMLSIPCIVMAAVNFYAAAYYLVFFIKIPRVKQHLPFAFLCFSVGVYDIFCVGLYNAQSLDNGVFWQRLQLYAVSIISIFLIWYTASVTGQMKNRIIALFIAGFLALLIAPLFIGPEYTVSTATPAIKHVNLFNALSITYYESEIGILYQFELVLLVVAYAYLLLLLIRHYRGTKNRILLFIIPSITVYFLGAMNDSAVNMQWYRFIYVSEYSFFVIVLAVAYVLLDDFVNIHKAYEDLNANLELKIEERTVEILEFQAHIKTLHGLIPICAGCKKIRNDKGYWENLERYLQSHSEAKFSHGLCPECGEKLYPDVFPKHDAIGNTLGEK